MTKVWNASSSSVISPVVEYPPVSFVALVSFVTLVHPLSLCDRVGLSVGGVVGSIHLLRRPLQLVSLFRCSLFFRLTTTLLRTLPTWMPQHRSKRLLARPSEYSVVSLCASSACLNVDTLTLHFSFLCTGSGVPIPSCFPFISVIFQLIDVHVCEVFDADPRVVRFFWWYHLFSLQSVHSSRSSQIN